MLSNLRHRFSTLALAGALSFGSGAALAETVLTDQEKLAADILSERGLTKVMILNEKKGHLLIVEDGKVVKTMSAVTGKRVGDDINMSKEMTPAGMYPLTPSPDLAHPKSSIMFYDVPGTPEAYTFHRVIKGREKALAGTDPAKKRLSNGCVNLFEADFRAVAGYTMTSAKTVVFPDGQKGHHASWVLILPESENLAKTREMLKYAATYRFE